MQRADHHIFGSTRSHGSDRKHSSVGKRATRLVGKPSHSGRGHDKACPDLCLPVPRDRPLRPMNCHGRDVRGCPFIGHCGRSKNLGSTSGIHRIPDVDPFEN